ncbi:hypothetical protein HK107_13295 [Parvularcula sp. ZS-1/3]|uniref:Uncharacterized protein n=1 Tax=Parvularcula mediterranea TaxID=2732508 RepID=A0A7Y3W601_9PROT|nr:hypothetical protein [Parvularcula mediterranea]NNU17300.1 hypothetical protein [Parvularcula mediterranea]
MSYSHSVVLIVPQQHKADAEAFGLSIGNSGAEYNVPLSTDGAEPATHYALHAFASERFLDELSGNGQGGQEAFAALNAVMTISVRPSMTGHFGDVLAAEGLQRVIPLEA